MIIYLFKNLDFLINSISDLFVVANSNRAGEAITLVDNVVQLTGR